MVQFIFALCLHSLARLSFTLMPPSSKVAQRTWPAAIILFCYVYPTVNLIAAFALDRLSPDVSLAYQQIALTQQVPVPAGS